MSEVIPASRGKGCKTLLEGQNLRAFHPQNIKMGDDQLSLNW